MKIYIKFIKRVVICFTGLVLISSCNQTETEELFDDSATVRTNKKIEELENLLVSSPEGWKAVYYTDDNILGGYNFLFKFVDDRNVEMASDFSSDLSVTTSEYSVNQAATVQLSFTTKGRIHELSDSDNSPDGELRGLGYKGAFQFSFYGVEGEELIFRDVKAFKEVRFVKANADDWATFLDETKTMLDLYIETNPRKSVFRNLEIITSDSTTLYSFNYDSGRRFASTTNVNSEGVETNINFGIAPTPSGFSIRPAIEQNNVNISEFTYDAINDEFIAEKDGVQITITYADEPSTPFTAQNIVPDFLILHNPFLNSLSSDWTPDLTNVVFEEFITNLNASIPFMDITRIDLNDLDADSGSLFIGSSIGNAFYNFTKEVKDDKLYLTIVSTNTPAFFTTAIRPLLDIIADPNGLYVDQPTTLNQFTNRIFTFVPASNTSIRYSAVAL